MRVALFLFVFLVGCQTPESRANRICKYFGGLSYITKDEAVCRDQSRWMLR